MGAATPGVRAALEGTQGSVAGAGTDPLRRLTVLRHKQGETVRGSVRPVSLVCTSMQEWGSGGRPMTTQSGERT